MQYGNFPRRFAKKFRPAAPGADRRIRRAVEIELLEVRRLFSIYNLTAASSRIVLLAAVPAPSSTRRTASDFPGQAAAMMASLWLTRMSRSVRVG
jgi:hypothetical protein